MYKCKYCNIRLTGGVDTFGAISQPCCLSCFLGGYKENVTEIPCPCCEGSGDIEHHCNCDLCDQILENCGDCMGEGVLHKREHSVTEWARYKERAAKLNQNVMVETIREEKVKLRKWNETQRNAMASPSLSN